MSDVLCRIFNLLLELLMTDDLSVLDDVMLLPLLQRYEKLISGPFKQKLTHSPRDELPNRIRR